jgi:hypothetical protein
MAKDIKVTMPDGLKRDFIKFGNTVAKHIASECRNSLVDEYKYSVAQFYAAYTPKLYNREYSLYNSYKPYYKNPHGSRAHGGVLITPENMGDLHHDSDAYVLSNALSGIHGDASIAVTPPWILQHMLTFRDLLYGQIDETHPFVTYAIAEAQKQNYEVLHF